VRIAWERQSLLDFGERPIVELAEHFDLLVIDHPLVPAAAGAGALVPLDSDGYEGQALALAAESVGPSHSSYSFGGRQWALAIDAASQVSAWRPDLMAEPPRCAEEIVECAKSGRLLWGLDPQQAGSSFCTLAAHRGPLPALAGEEFVTEDVGVAVLELMATIREMIPERCLAMDPPKILEELARSGTVAYTPLVFGYTNYAREGFRSHRLRFGDIAEFGGARCRGSVLGGAGIAVSARSSHREIAKQFSFFVAGARCQRSVYFDAGGQPANAVAWEDTRCNAATWGFFTSTRSTLEGAWTRPRDARYPAFHKYLGRLVHDALQDRSQPQSTIRGLNSRYRVDLGDVDAPRALPGS
jgi:multiple sugar transport system substrate-binding protein